MDIVYPDVSERFGEAECEEAASADQVVLGVIGEHVRRAALEAHLLAALVVERRAHRQARH